MPEPNSRRASPGLPQPSTRRRARRRGASPDWVVVAGLFYVFATPLDFVPTPFATPSTAFGMVFLTLWGFSLLSPNPRLPARSIAVPAMFGIALWSLVTMAWSWDPGLTQAQSMTFALLALSAVAVAGTFRQRVAAPAWALSLGAGAAALATLASGRELVEYQGTEVLLEQSTFLGIDQNILAFHLCLGLAAAAYLLISERTVTGRLFALALLGLVSVAILAVGSRTGAGSLVMTLAILALASARSPRDAVAWLLALGVAYWGYLRLGNAGLLPSRLVDWFSQPALNDNRTEIIAQFWYARDDWMIRGVGAGSDASYLLQTQGLYRNAHSAFWRIWIETGIVGLVLWATLLVALALRVFKSGHRLFFVLAAPSVAAFFYTLGPVNSNMLWVVFGLALGAAPVTRVARRRRGRDNSRQANRVAVARDGAGATPGGSSPARLGRETG